LTEDLNQKTNKRKGWSKKQNLIDWRRTNVVERSCKGQTQIEIAKALFVGVGTVNRDLSWFRARILERKTKSIERIQEEHEKSIIGLNAILWESWTMVESSKDPKEKLRALSLAKECYALREEFLSNTSVIDEALKFRLKSESEKNTESYKPKQASNNDPESAF
jgi:hypothetical protein